MSVADDLASIFRQDICNHHNDEDRLVRLRSPNLKIIVPLPKTIYGWDTPRAGVGHRDGFIKAGNAS